MGLPRLLPWAIYCRFYRDSLYLTGKIYLEASFGDLSATEKIITDNFDLNDIGTEQCYELIYFKKVDSRIR